MKTKFLTLTALMLLLTGCDATDVRVASSAISGIASDVAWAASRFYYWF